MLIVGEDSPDYDKLRTTAEYVIAGVRLYLAPKPEELLKSWYPDPAPGHDCGSYLTGVAVYMRYLLYAFQNNKDLQTYLRDPEWGYLDFVRKNAEHVVQNPSKNMTGLTNDLATLVAAIAMLP